MSDAQFIPALVRLASSTQSLDQNEELAGQELLRFDGEIYPSNGCAVTASTLLRSAGIQIPVTFLALSLVELLQKRGWQTILAADVRSGKVQLQPGDIGTTCYGGVRHPGTDHIYTVLKPMSEDENLIADNQSRTPHFRFIDNTGGKSPTTYFLRAS